MFSRNSGAGTATDLPTTSDVAVATPPPGGKVGRPEALASLVGDGMDRERAAAIIEAASRSGFDLAVVVRTVLTLRETGW
jgi:hypothetical protein